MQRLTIGIFDSGVGGLAILREVQARLPAAEYVYCFDNKHFPYGLRSEDEVIQFTLDAAQALVAQHQVNLLIIACNTASTVVLPPLRALLRIPVIGVVPAIKPAAAATKSGTIGLLATPGTVRRPYTDDLIAQHAPEHLVLRVGSSALVDLAERKLRGQPVDRELLRAEVAPLFAVVPGAAPVDCVVLGCTHFPLLLDELRQVSPWPVRWLDSGTAIAARAAALAEKHQLGAGKHQAGEYDKIPTGQAFCTRYDAAAQELEPALRSYGLLSLQELRPLLP